MYIQYSEGSSEEEQKEDTTPTFSGRARTNAPRETKKAAAALCVGVGHFSDPDDMPGLSHYLEHMLFMGSAKFPDENEYDSYLSKHNGSSNAFTEEETTTFHFDCAPLALKGALDRFSQFFVSPLVKPEALEREVMAVDNEFAGVIQNDACRLGQARAACARENHPQSKFGWGNKKSLLDIPVERGQNVRERLMDYYGKQYGAERMTLVVLSGESLDIMEDWVKEMFSNVPSGVGPRQKFDHFENPFDGGPTLSIIPAVKDEHKISILFQLPSSLEREYMKKAEDYISHLVGHEGKGSLLASLKNQELATDLCAGLMEQTSAVWLFEISISLSDLGLNAGPGCGIAIAKILFDYLDMLRSSKPQFRIWEEMAQISKMKWQFLEEEDSADYVCQIAADMQHYPIEHSLSWSYQYETYDADLVCGVARSY